MHFPPESQQKRLSKVQFLHLAKEAEVEANKRRWSAISERYLHPVKSATADSPLVFTNGAGSVTTLLTLI